MLDHNANLHRLYERCRERHIILNDEKTDMKKSEISFMGHQITKDGICADPNKVTAIREMPSIREMPYEKCHHRRTFMV